MTIEAISAIDPSQAAIAADLSIENSIQADFQSVMVEKIDTINESLAAADQVLQDLALDKPVSAHDVMLVMQQAKSELKMAVEVRNKLLEGYQEIMRMQV